LIALPHSQEAEISLLGTILMRNDVLRDVPDLRPEHFYLPMHGRIFAAICDIIDGGRVADGISVEAHIGKEDMGLRRIGGRLYIMRLLDAAAPLREQAIGYADMVRGLSLRRDIISTCREIAAAAAQQEDAKAPEEMLVEAQNALAALGSEGASWEAAWRPAGEIAASAVERAFAGQARGISTGLPKLDEHTGGGRPGSLWVIGGATSMGKSVGGQQFAVNVARQTAPDGSPYGVAYIHLEMDHDEVGLRLASALAWDFRRINELGERANPYYLSAANQNLKPDQWERMRRAAHEVAPDLQIFVDDRPGRTMAQIEAATLRLFHRMRRDGVTPGLWVVDHEGLIAPEQRYPSELEAARARATALKNMAKRLGVWGIALSQITKEGSRADGEERLPQSTDLNYGSALSQAAHVVILLHRKAYYAERKPHAARTEDDLRMCRSRETTLIVDKARGGRRGHIEAIMDVASAVLVESGEAA
jgi:replicative DNA helicase